MTDINVLLQEHLYKEQGRLDRIELKIDKLADAVIALARAEEKLAGLEEARDRLGERIGVLESRQETIDKILVRHTQVIDGLTKLMWLMVPVIFGLIASTLIL